MRAACEILYVNILLLSFTEDDIFQSAILSWLSQNFGASDVVNHINLHYRQFQMMSVSY